MAIQGVLSVIRDGKVIIKLVTGSDGGKLPELADVVRREKLDDTGRIYLEALKLGIGSMENLFVFDETSHRTNSGEGLGYYRDTFHNPTWNPRWESGTADYVEVVDTSEGEGLQAGIRMTWAAVLDLQRKAARLQDTLTSIRQLLRQVEGEQKR